MRQTVQYGPFTLSANGEATGMVLAQDFRHLGIDIYSSSVTTGFTLTVYASNQEERPDLTSAVSATNQYAPTQTIALADGDSISGATGIVVSADGVLRFELNDNNARWIGVKITAYTDGNAQINYLLSDNR